MISRKCSVALHQVNYAACQSSPMHEMLWRGVATRQCMPCAVAPFLMDFAARHVYCWFSPSSPGNLSAGCDRWKAVKAAALRGGCVSYTRMSYAAWCFSLYVERTPTSPSSVGTIECRMLRGAVSLHVERPPTSPSSVGTIECRMLRCAVTQHVDLPMRYAAVVSHTTLSGGGVE